MHPVECRQFGFFQKLSGADIGRQHALFDQAVGFGALNRNNLAYLALTIEQNTGFLGVEINRATLAAAFV